MAIGWSGQWSADVSANYSGSADSPNTNFRLRAGIPNLQIQLQPGEEIAGPVILIGNYKGQLAGGSNQLRRLIRNHYTPRLDGVELGMTRRYDTWTNIHEHYSESMLRPIVDTAAQLQQQYFILDAAWYEGCNGPRGFSGGVGN